VPEVPTLPGSRELADADGQREPAGSRPRGALADVALANAVASVFGAEGPLAAALDSFEARPGQVAMAAAVARTLVDGGVLLAEAGTGTGKTLAYLIPTILSGKRVLVSTGTKNLQEQLLTKDVPLLRRALRVPFTATVMKGRGNYLCLHRFEHAKHEPTANPTDRVYLTLVEEWLEKTDFGDRAEVEELPDDWPMWNHIAASTENCIGAECPRYSECFVTRMRQRAAESDVVIVNHHLLCADAAVRHHSFGEVIPDCHTLVIDEAHQIEEVATQYFGVAVSNHKIDDLVTDARRAARVGGIADKAQAADVQKAAERIESAAKTFFFDLTWKRPSTGAGAGAGSGAEGRPAADRPEGGGLFDERIRLTPEALDPVGESGLDLLAALEGLDAAIKLLKGANEDVLAIGLRAADVRQQLSFLLRVNDDAYVYFLELRGRGIYLRASPIDVSGIVRKMLLERMHASILTSATLAINGSFGYVRGRLGVGDAREIQLPSEFDYRRQSLLYLPKRMPDPRDRSFNLRAADEVIEITRRSEGRAFVLFTSYASLRAVETRLAEAVPYPLLVQGSAPRGVLLEKFKATPNAILLATSSFWQGVDVVGDALSCVIIDKLPFASPADPITAARIEAINARGGDAFQQYQVPVAILTLLQGLGRLLRHRTDRGVLAILDPRLQTMGYGRRFLAAMPPAPITRNVADIERFFQQRS
jgi:ATP-dependent DNA helicase DinG